MPALTIFGVTGRMGQSLVQALSAAPRLRLVGALASPGSAALGLPVPGAATSSAVRVTADARAAQDEPRRDHHRRQPQQRKENQLRHLVEDIRVGLEDGTLNRLSRSRGKKLHQRGSRL